jgi:hypothetical protein
MSRSKAKTNQGGSKAPTEATGIKLPKSPFKFLIMTEKEKKSLVQILNKAKIPNAVFLASYEEKIFG